MRQALHAHLHPPRAVEQLRDRPPCEVDAGIIAQGSWVGETDIQNRLVSRR